MRAIALSIFLVHVTLIAGLGEGAFRMEVHGEWTYDYEVSLFTGCGDLLIWDEKSMKLNVIRGNTRIPGGISLPRGEGPGEFLMVKSICGNGSEFFVWDSRARRITVFNREWKLKSLHRVRVGQISSLHGRHGKRWLFRYVVFSSEGPRRRIRSRVGWLGGDAPEVIWETDGLWSRGREYNNDRPHLLFAWCPPWMYFANNNEPRVLRMPDGCKKEENILELKVNHVDMPWQMAMGEMKWRVLKRPAVERMEVFPEKLPPLFGFVAEGDRLIAVSNDSLDRGKARLDLFKSGVHRGHCLIPMLYAQYFVFPPVFFHSSGMQLVGNLFYSLHYDEAADQYRLVCRRIWD